MKRIEFILDTAVIIFLVTINIFLFFNKVKIEDVYIFSVILISLNFMCTINKNKNNFLIFLFLVSNLVFLHLGIVFYILDNELIRGSFFKPYIFSIETRKEMIFYLYFNIIGIFLGHLFSKNKKYRVKKIVNEIFDSKKLYYIIILFSLIALAYNIKSTIIVNKLSYISKFNGESIEQLGKMRYFKYANNILEILFIFYLGNNFRKRKEEKKVILIFIIILVIESLKGGRGGTIYPLFMIIWYFYRYRNLKINILKISTLGFFIILFCFFISSRREKENFNKIKIVNIKNIKDFFKEQSGTASLIGYYIDYDELKIKTRPLMGSFILGGTEKLYNKLLSKDQIPETSFYYGERVSSVVNKKLYNKGYGLGGNYIVDMLDLLGKIGVLFLSIIYIFLLNYIQSNIKKFNLFLRALSLLFIVRCFYGIRSHYLTLGIVDIFILILLYIILNKKIKNIKRKNNGRVKYE